MATWCGERWRSEEIDHTYLLAVDDERHIELALPQLGQLCERGITLGLLLFGNQVRSIGLMMKKWNHSTHVVNAVGLVGGLGDVQAATGMHGSRACVRII